MLVIEETKELGFITGDDVIPVECPNENTCSLINELLERETLTRAETLFDIAYKAFDKTIFETDVRYQSLFSQLKQRAEQGFLNEEFYIDDDRFTGVFIQYLKDFGYEIITRLIYIQIKWDLKNKL